MKHKKLGNKWLINVAAILLFLEKICENDLFGLSFYFVSLFICLENKRFNHRPASRLSEITSWRTIYIYIYNSNLHEWREMKAGNRDES